MPVSGMVVQNVPRGLIQSRCGYVMMTLMQMIMVKVVGEEVGEVTT